MVKRKITSHNVMWYNIAMATKSMQNGYVISLSAPAKLNLGRILASAPTPQQKKSISKAKGKYALYQAKWQKSQ
jgi:hypothetical protein